MVNIYYFNDTGSHQCHIPPLFPSGLFSMVPPSLWKGHEIGVKFISTHTVYKHTHTSTCVYLNPILLEMSVCICSRIFFFLFLLYILYTCENFRSFSNLKEPWKTFLCAAPNSKGLHISCCYFNKNLPEMRVLLLKRNVEFLFLLSTKKRDSSAVQVVGNRSSLISAESRDWSAHTCLLGFFLNTHTHENLGWNFLLFFFNHSFMYIKQKKKLQHKDNHKWD